MPGTREGGLKSAAKLRAKDPNHFKKIAAKGGRSSGSRNGFKKRTWLDKLLGRPSRAQRANSRSVASRRAKRAA